MMRHFVTRLRPGDPVHAPRTLTTTQLTRERLYKEATRGEQCVVITSDLQPGNEIVTAAFNEWRELAWYEGKPDELFATLEADAKQWLGDQMESLFAELLSRPAQPVDQ